MKYSGETCVIWDSYDTKPDDITCCVHWGLGNKKNDCSIQEIVEKHDNKYRSRYLSFVHDIGHTKVNDEELLEYLDIGFNTSFWWMTTISEKCNYSKSPYIEDIIKLMAFSDWIKGQHYEKYLLVSNNVALSKSIKLLLKQKGINFQYRKTANKKISHGNNFVHFLKKMPYVAQSLLSISQNITIGFLLKDSVEENWKKSKAKVTFISYFDNMIPSEVNLGRYGSYYWGELTDFLKNEGLETNWVHIYVKDALLNDTVQTKKMIKKFNANERGVRNHITLQSFVNIRVVIESFRMWFQLLLKYFPVRKSIYLHSKHFWPLLSDDLKKSILGPNAINNIFFQSLFNRIFSLLPTQNCCYYLQENQGWEGGMINAYRRSNHQNYIIGVPHSVMKYWDLRHYHDKLTLREEGVYSRPFPSKVALNGDSALELYLDSGYKEKETVKVEALRYLHLNHVGKHLLKEQTKSNSRDILVLGDYLLENTFVQLMMLKTAVKKSNTKFNIFFKPHPNCQLSMAKFSDLNMEIVNDPVSDLIFLYQIVYASSRTSASVEAYYAGCSVIVFLDMNKLNSSPLRGCTGVYFVSTAQELLLGIEKSVDTYTKNTKGEYFYLNRDLSLWRERIKKDISIL
jgi:surface carbohydrate biosynthesis protein (TIGR04326 family)